MLFQSSPTSRGGRYDRGLLSVSSVSSFNPRPPLEVGATRVETGARKIPLGFNPRPPLEVGAT